jgi:prepilin-type N-terminal cleavage/methylation domain-containing protein
MIKKGFSLIELLVVVAIMAILIGLSAFGLQQARESARDGQRKSDLETIRTGLSFYRFDCNAYPIHTGSDFYTLFNPSFSSSCTGSTNTYIQKTPKDSLSGNLYYYISDGTTYTICASLETEGSTVPSGCPSGATGCGGYCNYAVYNP